MAVAALPAATLAADGDDRRRQGHDPHGHASSIPPHPSPGRSTRPATTSPSTSGPATRHRDADISGATWYGVVANGANVNVTGSQIHDIGDEPAQRHAARQCHLLLSTARAARSAATRSTTSRRTGSRSAARPPTDIDRSSVQDVRHGLEQRRDRRGPDRLHRPERHPDQLRRERHREEEHRQRLQLHTGRATRPLACCSGRPAASTSEQQDPDNEIEHLHSTARRGHVKP